MAFISLAIALGFALIFVIAVAVILYPGFMSYSATVDGAMLGICFIVPNGLLLPFVFMASAGIGLVYSVIRLRPRLATREKARALSLSGVLISIGVFPVFATAPFWRDCLNFAVKFWS